MKGKNMFIKSPNFSSRNGRKPLAVVIHLADGTSKSVIEEFSSTASQKSSHYLVCEDSSVVQFVDESQAAWTQGVVRNPTSKIVQANIGINPNLYCISIEHAGFSKDDISVIMYETTAKLVRDICQRHVIPIDDNYIIRHNSIRDDKVCPGKIDVNKIIQMANDLNVVEEKKISLLQQIIQLYQNIIKLLLGK